MTVAAGGADMADDGQHHVLGGHASAELALHAHAQVLHLLGDQALGGQHVLHLAGADAVGQRTEGAVGGGVRVTADHGHARQGGALLRADHVDDALTAVVHLELEDAEVIAVLVEGLHLNARHFIDDGFQATLALGLGGRHVVVRGGDVGVDAPRLAPGQTQPLEGLRRGHFVENLPVNVDQRRTVVAALDLMHLPELVVQRFASHQLSLISVFICQGECPFGLCGEML